MINKINRLKKIIRIIGCSALIIGSVGLNSAFADNSAIFIKKNHRSVELEVGDRLINDARERSEIQLSHANIFVGLNTEAKIKELYKNANTFELKKGSLSVRIHSATKTTYRIRSGELVFVMKKAGLYRMDVSANRQAVVRVYSGQGQIQRGKNIEVINKGDAFRFFSNQSFNYQLIQFPGFDGQDQFSGYQDTVEIRKRPVVIIDERPRVIRPVVRPVVHQRVIYKERNPTIVIDAQPLVDGLLGRPRVVEHHYHPRAVPVQRVIHHRPVQQVIHHHPQPQRVNHPRPAPAAPAAYHAPREEKMTPQEIQREVKKIDDVYKSQDKMSDAEIAREVQKIENAYR